MKNRKNHLRNAPQAPKFALRKATAFWELTFEGHTSYFKNEQGAAYVTYLLLNPPDQPIHGLDLATRLAATSGKQKGMTEIIDPASGRRVILSADARIQERSPELDNAALMRRVLRKQEELEAILEDEDQIEPVKAEVQRELIALYNYEKNSGKKVLDSAQKAVRSVRMAIQRFHRHLASALDARGFPHPVLRPFAVHLEQYLLIPSRRCSTGLAGCFTYTPPPGVVWTA